MRLVPFSLDLCRELIDKGYHYFVIQNQQDANGFFSPQSAFTFEAVRANTEGVKSVSITEMMEVKARTTARYTVICGE